MTRRLMIALASLVLVSGAACSSGDDEPAGTTLPGTDGGASTETTAPSPSTTLDQGPFCVAIRGLESLGTETENPTPEQVLAENEAFLSTLDEAIVNVPDGAPTDVEALFDDYRAIAEAIGAAAGDVDAAYAQLAVDQPELTARLSDPNAHRAAFEFFAAHCGTPLP